jgi:transcription factor SPN1
VDERQRQLAPPTANNNRAKPAGLPATYTVAPRSTFDPNRNDGYRPLGAGGLEAFRKMTQKGKKK